MSTTETVILEVQVQKDEFGRINSSHDFQTHHDRERSLAWDGCGVNHIAHALLVEAARREAYAATLIRLQQEPDFLSSYREASPEGKTEIEMHLSNAVRTIIHSTLGKLGPDVAREVLTMMLQSVRQEGPHS